MSDIRKCPLHGDMYLTEAFDGKGEKVTILEVRYEHVRSITTEEARRC